MEWSSALGCLMINNSFIDGDDMSKSMLFYKKIEALSAKLHSKLKLDKTNKYGFASHSYWVPLAGIEFLSAGKNYPVIFLQEGDHFIPSALLGLKDGQNLFVDSNGDWEASSYIPAFVRRYPFVLAKGTPESEELTVCLDLESPQWTEAKDAQALFTESGDKSPFLEGILQFLSAYHADMARTQEFSDILQREELLSSQTVTITGERGQTFDVQNVYIIDEKKWMGLSGDLLAELNQKGMLAWVYAHLFSLNNFPGIYDRFLQKKESEGRGALSSNSDRDLQANHKKNSSKKAIKK